jgi:hypothetical protein
LHCHYAACCAECLYVQYSYSDLHFVHGWVMLLYSVAMPRLADVLMLSVIILIVFMPRVVAPLRHCCVASEWRHDTRHNDIQHSDTQHSDTQHSDTQHSDTQNKNTQNKKTQNKNTQNKNTQNKNTQNKNT